MISVVYRFLRQPKTNQELLVESVFLVWSAGILLPMVSLRRVRRILSYLGRVGRGAHSAVPIYRVVRAVSMARRYSPFACLAMAIAGQVLMARYGHAAKLCIGAARNNGVFTAHAWLEKDGRVILGGPDSFVRQYTPFPNLDEVAL